MSGLRKELWFLGLLCTTHHANYFTWSISFSTDSSERKEILSSSPASPLIWRWQNWVLQTWSDVLRASVLVSRKKDEPGESNPCPQLQQGLLLYRRPQATSVPSEVIALKVNAQEQACIRPWTDSNVHAAPVTSVCLCEPPAWTVKWGWRPLHGGITLKISQMTASGQQWVSDIVGRLYS